MLILLMIDTLSVANYFKSYYNSNITKMYKTVLVERKTKYVWKKETKFLANIIFIKVCR